MKADGQNIVEAMRDASGQAGLSKEASHFERAATRRQKTANRWLGATIALAAVFLGTAGFLLFAYRWDRMHATAYESVQLVAAKLVLFAVLSYVVLLCGRNYLANRHNAVVNQHRQNALLTYQALVEAGKDKANRDVVLQAAAACIFGSQATGFTRESRRDPHGKIDCGTGRAARAPAVRHGALIQALGTRAPRQCKREAGPASLDRRMGREGG